MTATATVDARITTSTTPNGTVITFQTEPKRTYTVNGNAVPSVTEVLKVLDKSGPLIWWGWKIGALGVIELIREGKLQRANGHAVLAPWDGVAGPITEEQVVDLLKANHLTTNHAVNKAGDRGVKVHDALEAWCNDRTLIPDPEFYPEEERGYIEALRAFIGDVKINGRAKIVSEIMVGSVQHGFAGRFDLRLPLLECELVVKRTPVRGETREVFAKGTYLGDAKTSAGVYDSHFLQLEAYEGASIEDGYKPTDGRFVLRLDKDGWYEVRRSNATYQDFLAVKATHDMLRDLKARKA